MCCSDTGNNPGARVLGRTAIERLENQGHELCLCARNVIEYWAVATRPVAQNGFELAHADVDRDLADFEQGFEILTEPADVSDGGGHSSTTTASPGVCPRCTARRADAGTWHQSSTHAESGRLHTLPRNHRDSALTRRGDRLTRDRYQSDYGVKRSKANRSGIGAGAGAGRRHGLCGVRILAGASSTGDCIARQALKAENPRKESLRRLLIRGADVNVVANHRMTALVVAAGSGDLALLEEVLARGAMVNGP